MKNGNEIGCKKNGKKLFYIGKKDNCQLAIDNQGIIYQIFPGTDIYSCFGFGIFIKMPSSDASPNAWNTWAYRCRESLIDFMYVKK